MSSTDDFEAFLDRYRGEFVSDLKRLVAQPSVSSTGRGMSDCLDIVRETCSAYGFDDVETIQTPGYPAVLASARSGTSSAQPEVIIYGHYDVQPADPDEWETDPFEPQIRDGPDGTPRLYGRGAGDNKGQFFAHLCAVQTLRETGGLPVDVTLLLDGEGEDGSPNLREVVQSRIDDLQGELLYWADGNAHSTGRPQVWLGSRGLIYAELTIRTDHDSLHSGHNSPLANPAQVLVNLLSSLKDADGEVTLEGFRNDIRAISSADRELLDSIPYDELGEDDPDFFRELFFEPTLNISGISSGYTGDGKRAIIPGSAEAKLDIRLVPDQDPDGVFEAVRSHVREYAREHVPDGMEVDLTMRSRVKPNRTPPDSPVVNPVVAAVRSAWGRDPIVQPISGGSGPDYVFDEIGLPVVLVTYGNADENQHGPNENLSIDCFERGIRATAQVFQNIADLRSE